MKLFALGFRISHCLVAVAMINVWACAAKKDGKKGGGKSKDVAGASPPSSPSPGTGESCLTLQDEATDEDAEEQAPGSGPAGEEEGEDGGTEGGDEGGVTGTAPGKGAVCKPKPEPGVGGDPGTPAPPAAGPTPTPGGGGTGLWQPGPGPEGCAKQGKVWLAIDSSSPTKSGVCGEALASFCCTEDEIGKAFPNLKAQLDPKFAQYKQEGFKLYGCSTDGAAKTTFHWAQSGVNGIQYRNLWVGSKSAAGAPPATCPAVTLADLGITNSPGGTGTGVGTGSGTGTVPATIGPITDTSIGGLLTYLKGGAYKSWTAEAAPRASAAHGGMVRTFINDTLKTSLAAAGATSHPVGAVAIKELYKADGTTLDGFAVLAKGAAGQGKDQWLMYLIKGAPAFGNPPTAYGMGIQTCADCHQDGKDFIKNGVNTGP